MLKRFAVVVLSAVLAAVMLVAPAVAKSASDKPAKAYWYSPDKKYYASDFALHVSPSSSNQLDYLRADGGCDFYRQNYLTKLPVKLKNNKFSYSETINAFSTKDQVQTQITVKVDAKFTNGKFKGKYTMSDPSSECTAEQKAEHKFTAKKRVKQTGG